jgi:hypothetical protein
MITVSMREDGPDVDPDRGTRRRRPGIEGMWCVPVYSNPTDTTLIPGIQSARRDVDAANLRCLSRSVRCAARVWCEERHAFGHWAVDA